MKYSLLVLIVVLLSVSTSQNLVAQTNFQASLAKCYGLYNQKEHPEKLINYLHKKSKTIDENELYSLYDSLILKTLKESNFDYSFNLMLEKVKSGCTYVMILEDSIANVLKVRSLEQYRILEEAVNREFINKSLKYYPTINFELAFIIRHLFRLDQRTKLKTFDKKNKPIMDSLRKIAIEQDSITEHALIQIFDEYGYPGISLTGEESSTCFILMLHVSSTFCIKYIHLVQQAIEEKELYADLDFLIDKTLHKCCGKTIYGTLWTKYSPLVTDPVEVENLKALLKIH